MLRGLELIWWTLIVFVLAVIVFLIFFYFVKTGVIQIGNLAEPIFNAPNQFANMT